MVYLTLKNTKSNKFWAARELSDGKIIAQYGKLNTKGIFATYKETKSLGSLIDSKMKKGYTTETFDSLPLFNMKEAELLSKWNELNIKKQDRKKKIKDSSKRNVQNDKCLGMLTNLGPRTLLRDNQRKAKFFNCAEQITPYYYYSGVIKTNFEYAAYLLELHKNNLPLPSMTSNAHRMHRFDLDKDEIAEKAFEKRIQKYINSVGDTVQVGDIFFVGTYNDDFSEYPIHEELKVLDENRQLVTLKSRKSSDFQVDYTEITQQVNDFCQLEMVGWDEYYETQEDKPFYRFLNA
jgi:predicted DNA-binding WGR domain protein